MKFNSNREGASFRSLLCTPTAAAVDSDPTNKAVQLTAASSQYLSKADAAAFSFGDEDFSFACWVQFDSVGADRTIISKLDAFSSGNEEYWLFLNGGSNQLKFWVYNSTGTRIGDVTTTAAVTTGVWYFVECGHDSVANQVWISLNGGTRDTAATTGVPWDGTSTFKIGANTSSNTELMNGRIDSLSIWRKALSASEVSVLFNAGLGLKYSQATNRTNLTAWYDFAASEITTDSSGSNTLTNNGTATNATGITTNNGAFLLTSVSGLTAWWDVCRRSPQVDATQLSPLTDNSGNSKDLTGVSAGPVYYNNIKNGRPIVRSNGTSQYYDYTSTKTLGNLISASAFTIYFVAKVTVDTDDATIENNDCLLGTYTAARHFGLYFRTSNGLTATTYDGTTAKTATTAYTSATWAIITMKLDSGTLSIRVNNNTPATVGSVSNVDATTLAQQLYVMSGPVAYTGADLAEGATFNVAVGASDDNNILSYLNTKWAVY